MCLAVKELSAFLTHLVISYALTRCLSLSSATSTFSNCWSYFAETWYDDTFGQCAGARTTTTRLVYDTSWQYAHCGIHSPRSGFSCPQDYEYQPLKSQLNLLKQ
jgi:hypothetical protein